MHISSHLEVGEAGGENLSVILMRRTIFQIKVKISQIRVKIDWDLLQLVNSSLLFEYLLMCLFEVDLNYST
jgi:hypothetical protein